MEYNIRAISRGESIAAESRRALADFLGQQIEFRRGVSIRITLPDSPEQFGLLQDPERLLTALSEWVRVYQYPQADAKILHVLAAAEGLQQEILFYRIDLKQPAASRRGPRPAVEILGGSIMISEACATWLVELAHSLAAARDQLQRPLILARPPLVKCKSIRMAWVGPEILENQAMSARLRAIGQVYGAEIVHIITPRRYSDVKAQLAGMSPLDSVIICSHFAPHIKIEAVPQAVCRKLIHFCASKTRSELEQQVRTWIEIVVHETESNDSEERVDETQMLLAVMLRGMLSHSKIGQFNHCQKETVLTGIRARRLNVAIAERILDCNSEPFQDTKDSTAMFLWKEHHDGRQYFLNPRRVEDIKVTVALLSTHG